MKKALRYIVPLLLLIAVIACSIWYLFVYDREFTRDVLLQQARSFESRGNHTISAWLYDLAYYQSGEADDIAIELAEQHIVSGNYTKAEYTLSNAIFENPTAELYAALCRVYVQQDKLMDAVTILDTITDPDIKAVLDAQRPAVPAVTPEPDFYSQYISVEVTAPSGTVYVSTDGQYPSVAEHAYSGPIQLALGETKICALSVGEDLLVSSLGIYGYTVGGIIEEVTFTDAAMESALRTALGVDADTMVFTNDLWAITEFTVPQDAVTYADLAHLPYLQSLTVENGITEQLQYITALRDLTQLHLINCNPSEELLTAIASLPQLNTLTLRSCGLSTVSPLSAAVNLQYLDLSDNTLRNLAPLSGMTGLKELYLSNNALTDLSALTPLTNLQVLEAAYNSLASIEPLGNMTALTRLDVSHNKLPSLGSISSATGLTHLYASHNSLTNVSGISRCTVLQELDISNNSVADITMLGTLVDLTWLDFSYNAVTALPAFSKECTLVTIDGSHNLLTTIDELAGLSDLNNVLLDYNEELADLTPLDSCHRLILVNAYGTKVTEVKFLTDKSVIVNYNPALED